MGNTLKADQSHKNGKIKNIENGRFQEYANTNTPKNISSADLIIQIFWYYFYWLMVVVAILPASLFCDAYEYLRNYLAYKLNIGAQTHNQKVDVIQKQVCFS